MYKVGKKTLNLEDHNRPNWLGQGNRPLLTEIWYPAPDNVETCDFAFGSPEPLFKFDAIAENVAMNNQQQSYPLILLSHGTGGSALGMGWLGHYLASQGYIAASVNHHGNNAIEPYLAHGFMLWWERATDFTVLIDNLLNDIDFFENRIDDSKIGVAGFSLGGFTSILLAGGRCDPDSFQAFCETDENYKSGDKPREFPTRLIDADELIRTDDFYRESWQRRHASYREPRIKAAFAIAPAISMAFVDESLAEIDIPVQMIATEVDTEVPPDNNACRYARLIPGAALELLQGFADHYVFLCEATDAGKRLEAEICVDHVSVNRRSIHQKVSGRADEFFRQSFSCMNIFKSI